jgi:hypothetical protein
MTTQNRAAEEGMEFVVLYKDHDVRDQSRG